MRPLSTTLLFSMLLPAVSCRVDTDIPNDALLSCTEDAQCPDGWSCDAAQSLCRPDDGQPTGDDGLAEIKASFCAAVYDKAQECQAEVQTTLGEAAQLFLLQRDEFIAMCSTELLGDIDQQTAEELPAQRDSIPLAPCSMFAPSLCDLFAAQDTYETNCPSA